MRYIGLAFTLLLSAQAALAQLTTKQVACVNALNRDGAKLAAQQGKVNAACVKGAGKGTLTGTAQSCLSADPDGKVTAKQAKTTADEDKYCRDAPDFGYTSATAVNTAGQQGEWQVVADLFGADLDAAVASCASSKRQCACQQKVTKAVEKLATTERGLFVKCNKGAVATASGPADLEKCATDALTAGSIAAGTAAGGKVDKALTKLGAAITKSCDTPTVTLGSFPGPCAALAGTPLRDCLAARVACRVCETLDAMDGLTIDCDAFDDGIVNASCSGAIAPAPSATATLSPTATPTNTVPAGPPATATNTPTNTPTTTPTSTATNTPTITPTTAPPCAVGQTGTCPDPNTPVCNTATGKCVQCLSNRDCLNNPLLPLCINFTC